MATNNRDLIKKEIENYLYNVKSLRLHHGITKKQMAKILGISIGSMNKIERGTMPPRLSVKIIINIYNYFCLLSEEMFTRKFDENDMPIKIVRDDVLDVPFSRSSCGTSRTSSPTKFEEI